MRYTHRPRCIECKAAFTDERWQTMKCTSRDALPPEARPTLRGDCDQQHETDWEEAWPDATRQGPEQEPAVPEQEATGWLSRLCR